MKLSSKSAMAVMVLVTAMAFTALAQGPMQKRIDYAINVSHAVKMGDYVLPAGNYVLRQVMQNDLNLFALHPEDLTNEPIAMIRTTRVDFQSSGYPNNTKIVLTIDEERQGRDNLPVLKGWTIPGMDGWEVIGVVEKKKGVLARAD